MTQIIPKQIIPTHATRGHIDVDACVIWCIDPRFRKALWDFEKARGFKYIDVIKHPGGGKALAGDGPCKQVVLEDVATSVKLHKPKVIVPMFHFDCGAYKPLELNRQSELHFLESEVKKAKKSLEGFGLPIQPVIVGFDKIMVF